MILEILLKDSVSIDYMIGVGLAGFFVLSETNSNSRIVINLWFSPSQKLSQKRTVSNDLLRTLKKIEIFPKQISKKCQFCNIIIKSIVEEFM